MKELLIAILLLFSTTRWPMEMYDYHYPHGYSYKKITIYNVEKNIEKNIEENEKNIEENEKNIEENEKNIEEKKGT